MKTPTKDLIGPALDWAVAKCAKKPYRFENSVGGDYNGNSWWVIRRYSTDWSQAGPIIDREHIEFDYDEATQMYTAANGQHAGQGKTHLIAAMRCYVASKLGDEVDVPEELT